MNRRPAGNRRRGGTAMMEMVLVLPFIIMIIALLLYFGRGVMRVQRVQVADRYESWREAAGAPDPLPVADPSDPAAVAAAADNRAHLLNQTFFSINPFQSLAYSYSGSFPGDAAAALVEAAGLNHSVAAQDLVRTAVGDFPAGSAVALGVTHTEPVTFYQRFAGAINHSHTRMHHEWKFVNRWHQQDDGVWKMHGGGPWMLDETRKVFFQDLEAELTPLDEGGNHLARFLRSVYTEKPAYQGPTIEDP